MEKYNKKGKICIKLLILCITCLLSLNLFSNANAAETISNLRRTYVQKINFVTYTPNNTYNDQTIYNYVYSDMYSTSINAGNTFRISGLAINLYDSLSYNKNDRWDLTIYLYTFLDAYRGLGGETLIPTAICPAYTSINHNLIDKCDIEYHDMIDAPIDVNSLGNNNYAIQNKIHGYYAVKLNGHFAANGSGNAMSLLGPLLAVKNSAALTLDLNYMIGFSPFRIYEEVSNNAAEEEVAEKELEDRDNLETQQGETENNAEDSSQDIESATTNITGVISAFVGNLQNLNANNCTLPEISAYGFSIGQLNLCTFSPPNWIAGITNVVVSLITLGLAYHLFKRIMGIAKSLAGGK